MTAKTNESLQENLGRWTILGVVQVTVGCLVGFIPRPRSPGFAASSGGHIEITRKWGAGRSPSVFSSRRCALDPRALGLVRRPPTRHLDQRNGRAGGGSLGLLLAADADDQREIPGPPGTRSPSGHRPAATLWCHDDGGPVSYALRALFTPTFQGLRQPEAVRIARRIRGAPRPGEHRRRPTSAPSRPACPARSTRSCTRPRARQLALARP